jgi:hypothetical protein
MKLVYNKRAKLKAIALPLDFFPNKEQAQDVNMQASHPSKGDASEQDKLKKDLLDGSEKKSFVSAELVHVVSAREVETQQEGISKKKGEA